MASISSLNQFPLKTLQTTSQHSKFTSRPSKFTVNSIKFTAKNTKQRSIFSVSIKESVKTRRSLAVQAISDGFEGVPDEGVTQVSSGGVAVAEEEPLTEIEILKKKLVDSFYGTNRGLSATSETRAEIGELITQLEAINPTPAPTEALTLLNGKWILAYTTFVGLFPLLSGGTLPLVRLEEISQTIDSENFTVQNSVLFAGPLSTTSIITNAKFEVRSPKRVQLKFEEGIIGTPQLTDSIVLPENIEFLGQKFDLAPFKGLITSVQDTASSVAKTISSQPPLKFSFSNKNAESWLLTTYLDDEVRITRGDGGSVFVLIKEGNPLLLP